MRDRRQSHRDDMLISSNVLSSRRVNFHTERLAQSRPVCFLFARVIYEGDRQIGHHVDDDDDDNECSLAGRVSAN